MDKYNYNLRLIQNKKKIKKYSNTEIDILLFRSLLVDINISIKLKIYIKNQLKINRINKVCIVSGNSRGIYSSFKQHRMLIKNNFANNKLAGLRRSSW